MDREYRNAPRTKTKTPDKRRGGMAGCETAVCGGSVCTTGSLADTGGKTFARNHSTSMSTSQAHVDSLTILDAVLLE